MKFESLLKGEFFNHALKFEVYWNTQGKYNWNKKHNAWINWLHGQWNQGLISVSEYRVLINIEFED